MQRCSTVDGAGRWPGGGVTALALAWSPRVRPNALEEVACPGRVSNSDSSSGSATSASGNGYTPTYNNIVFSKPRLDFLLQYTLRPKTSGASWRECTCFRCRMRSEDEETVEHRTHDTAYNRDKTEERGHAIMREYYSSLSRSSSSSSSVE